jgi:hypothetical protein
VFVRGREKPPLTGPRYDVVKVLVDRPGEILSGQQLDDLSGHTDARKILQRLADSDDDWRSVIIFLREPWKGGYGIAAR